MTEKRRVITLDVYWQIQPAGDPNTAVPVTSEYWRGGSHCGIAWNSVQLLEIEPGVFAGTLEQKRSTEDELDPYFKVFAEEPKAIARQLIGLLQKAWRETADPHEPAEIEVIMRSYKGEGFAFDVEILTTWTHPNVVMS